VLKGLEQLLPFVLIVAVFYLLLIRPQRRRQAQLAQTQRAVEPGDDVMLGAGIVGKVASTSKEFVHIEVSPGVEMRVARAAVVRRLTPEELMEGEQPDELDRPDDVDGPDRPEGH
jgi:preprotein translocase subunit YajC